MEELINQIGDYLISLDDGFVRKSKKVWIKKVGDLNFLIEFSHAGSGNICYNYGFSIPIINKIKSKILNLKYGSNDFNIYIDIMNQFCLDENLDYLTANEIKKSVIKFKKNYKKNIQEYYYKYDTLEKIEALYNNESLIDKFIGTDKYHTIPFETVIDSIIIAHICKRKNINLILKRNKAFVKKSDWFANPEQEEEYINLLDITNNYMLGTSSQAKK